MIDFTKGPHLIGVVNVTPDSFSDGGNFLDPDGAVQHGLKLIEQGANILDIGGESTRPNADIVSPLEEQNRVLPVIEGLKKAMAKTGNIVPLSLDTRNAETMQKGIDLGVDIINDISSLQYNSHSLNIVSKAQIPVILMHMQGTPQTMQDKPHYDDVVTEIFSFLQARIQVCTDAGIKRENIIVDPGIGFGKTLADNLALLRHLNRFHDLGVPVLLGASRKSFIEAICPNTPADQRLAGSLAAALQGLEQNVQLFRVHDVRQTKQTFDVWRAMRSD